MANFEVELNDSLGNPVNFGDTIRVTLPELEFYRPNYDEKVYIAERLVQGTVWFWLSRGLVLKVEEIIEAHGPHDTRIGQVLPLKRTMWHWERVNGCAVDHAAEGE